MQTYLNVGTSFIPYAPQYKPTAEMFFTSKWLAGIFGISPDAKPTTNNRPSQAMLQKISKFSEM